MDVWVIVNFAFAATPMSFAAASEAKIKKLQKRLDKLEK
jgi:hypothetical protein